MLKESQDAEGVLPYARRLWWMGNAQEKIGVDFPLMPSSRWKTGTR